MTKYHALRTKQFLPILLVLISVLSFSQKKIKYKTVYFDDNMVETPNAKVSLLDAVSEDNLMQFADDRPNRQPELEYLSGIAMLHPFHSFCTATSMAAHQKYRHQSHDCGNKNLPDFCHFNPL